MSKKGTLLHCTEASRFVEAIDDPVTKSLVNMAFVHFVKKVHLEKEILPEHDLDMLFLVTLLKEFFAEHDVIDRTLKGEIVGEWFPNAGNAPVAEASRPTGKKDSPPVIKTARSDG